MSDRCVDGGRTAPSRAFEPAFGRFGRRRGVCVISSAPPRLNERKNTTITRRKHCQILNARQLCFAAAATCSGAAEALAALLLRWRLSPGHLQTIFAPLGLFTGWALRHSDQAAACRGARAGQGAGRQAGTGACREGSPHSTKRRRLTSYSCMLVRLSAAKGQCGMMGCSAKECGLRWHACSCAGVTLTAALHRNTQPWPRHHHAGNGGKLLGGGPARRRL